MTSDTIRIGKVSFASSCPGNSVYSWGDEMASLLDNQPLKLPSHSSLAGNKQRNYITLFFLMPLQGIWQIPVLPSLKDCCEGSLHKVFIHRKLLVASGKDFVHGLLKALTAICEHEHLEWLR